jgi:hypothetical protein
MQAAQLYGNLKLADGTEVGPDIPANGTIGPTHRCSGTITARCECRAVYLEHSRAPSYREDLAIILVVTSTEKPSKENGTHRNHF